MIKKQFSNEYLLKCNFQKFQTYLKKRFSKEHLSKHDFQNF